MTVRAACYLHRGAGGSALVRVRYVDARGSRTWNAPLAPASAGARRDEAVRQHITDAARFVHELLTSASQPQVLDIVADLTGGLCGWLSTRGSDEKTVRATVQAAQLAGDDAEHARSAWMTRGELGEDLSLQPLTDTPASAGVALKTAPRIGPPRVDRQRLAVLAVADLGVRLFLDDLDALGTPVGRVMNLWHALALAWDPAGAPESLPLPIEQGGPELVADAQPVSAVCVVEPDGKLAWCWTRSGSLVAGGTLRLCVTEPASEPSEPEPAHADESVRRIGPRPTKPSGGVIELSPADTGRLTSEWLAWSTQLGIAPAQLIVLAPPGLTPASGGVGGAAALAGAIGRLWPGTGAIAEDDDDPVGATLARFLAAGARVPAVSDDAPAPGRGLLELSRRPGRTHRTLYLWLGVCMGAAAVTLAAVGYKIRRQLGAIEEQRQSLLTQRSDALKRVSDLVKIKPGDDEAAALTSKLKALRDQRSAVRPSEPALGELIRFLQAAGELPEGQLMNVSIDGTTVAGGQGMIALSRMSFTSVDTGPLLLEKLAAARPSDRRYIEWNGRLTGANGEKVDYSLSGPWRDPPKPTPKPVDAAPASAPAPANVPASSPAPAAPPKGGGA